MRRITHLAKRAVYGFHFYTFGLLRRLYNWTISWAPTKYGLLALFILAFAESSFFPIPPDVLLIALCVSAPKRSFFFAGISSIGSILGGMMGYGIGFALFETVGKMIIGALHLQQQFDMVGKLFSDNAFLAILGSAFTPIPYKVFTISAGVWKINFLIFLLASAIGRSGRFFLVGGMIYLFGEKMRALIEKYFDILSLVFFALLIAGFFVIKYMM